MFGTILITAMMALTSVTGVQMTQVTAPSAAARAAYVAAFMSPESAQGPVVLPELKKGDLGPFVIMLQSLLNDEKMAKPKLVLDGVFGKGTKAAVIKYQMSESDEGLRTDGVVDDATWRSITTLD